jgi:hypothetical protein
MEYGSRFLSLPVRSHLLYKLSYFGVCGVQVYLQRRDLENIRTLSNPIQMKWMISLTGYLELNILSFGNNFDVLSVDTSPN